ncbi:hypothetical protein ACIU1J_25615 [Azospirillum doebereinerae]|nr:hypothetical protein [Azospirillum doebereinerae]
MLTRMLIQGLAAAAIIAVLAGAYQAGGSGLPTMAAAHHDD